MFTLPNYSFIKSDYSIHPTYTACLKQMFGENLLASHIPKQTLSPHLQSPDSPPSPDTSLQPPAPKSPVLPQHGLTHWPISGPQGSAWFWGWFPPHWVCWWGSGMEWAAMAPEPPWGASSAPGLQASKSHQLLWCYDTITSNSQLQVKWSHIKKISDITRPTLWNKCSQLHEN